MRILELSMLMSETELSTIKDFKNVLVVPDSLNDDVYFALEAETILRLERNPEDDEYYYYVGFRPLDNDEFNEIFPDEEFLDPENGIKKAKLKIVEKSDGGKTITTIKGEKPKLTIVTNLTD